MEEVCSIGEVPHTDGTMFGAQTFLANRVIAPWNSLNLFEDNVKSVATFKRLLLESDLSCYCILNLDWLYKVN